VKYVRKKAPLMPNWQSSFDSHIYPGRTFEMIVMQRPESNVGDVTISAQALSDHCKTYNDIATIWVRAVMLMLADASFTHTLCCALHCVALRGER